MNRTPHHRSQPFDRRSAAPSLFGTLEWDELPWLATPQNRPEFSFAGPAWTATQRLELLDFADAPPAVPFAEPIRGLHVREIDGSDLFCHFFGQAASSH